MAERVCCLYRVSTARQVDLNDKNQADIPVQRKACRDFAEKMGWRIVYEEQETGVSGFKIRAEDRDKIQVIREYALQDKFDILLVFMFDRIGRRSEETPFVVEWFAKQGIRIWSVNEGEQKFESHTDRLTNYIRYWQADGESRKTSIRTKTALAQMVKEGRYRGGSVPYGYRLVKTGMLNKRKQEVYELAIDEDEAEIVRMMFDLCISAGYGRWKMTNFLNDKGIKNRKGLNWHDATVGYILQNVAYTGVLKSGDTYSEPFEHLQIIDPDTFKRAQDLIFQRRSENSSIRTMPFHVSGKSLMSGNIFCGHCGGRLVLTTNIKLQKMASGEVKRIPRPRYICYNKTRRRKECDGQTGYAVHLLDPIVTEVIHGIFNRLNAHADDLLIDCAQEHSLIQLKAEITKAKSRNTKAKREYESLKKEIVKAVQGKSKMSVEVLSELVDESQEKILETSHVLTELTQEYESGNAQVKKLKSELKEIKHWSEIFDECDMAVRKMITGYLIKKITVRRDYKLDIELNMTVEQFLNGLDQLESADIKCDKLLG